MARANINGVTYNTNIAEMLGVSKNCGFPFQDGRWFTQELYSMIKIYRPDLAKGQNFSLHYDFGDDWMFTIHVQEILIVMGHPKLQLLRDI